MANLTGKLLPSVEVISAATDSVTAQEARDGNHYFVIDRGGSGANTLSLPSAETGMKIAVARGNATAGEDVTVSAASGDTILGSNAGKAITNDTDAISAGFLHLIAENDGEWSLDDPLPVDYAEWEIDNS